jgi:hypothetical protein
MSTVVVHELTDQEAHAICVVLRAQHIPVTVAVVDRTAHIHPCREVSTYEEVTAMRAFFAVTDSVVFHSFQSLGGVR